MAEDELTVPLTGGCRCGVLRYQIATPPLFVLACHCTDCQEQTASAFSLGMPVAEDGFALDGVPMIVPKTGESGSQSRAYRCPACAVWTHTVADASAGLVIVRPSTLDDADWVKPVAQIFVRSAMDWARLDVPHSYDKEFDDPQEIVATFRASGIGPY